jgi:hypothetical protein
MTCLREEAAPPLGIARQQKFKDFVKVFVFDPSYWTVYDGGFLPGGESIGIQMGF